MRMLALLLGGLSLAQVEPAAQAPDFSSISIEIRHALRPEFDRDLFFAALEGLYRDGVSNEIVDVLLALEPSSGWPSHFVYACPVCMPIFDALRTYRGRPVFFGDKQRRDTFGPGLSPELSARLTDRDAATRLGALRELTEGWIAARLESKRPTQEERATWKDEMAKRKEQGLICLKAYRKAGFQATYGAMETCPSCEAADEICSAPR
jgi:hypothetical protein